MSPAPRIAVEMTVVESPKGGASPNLGNRCAIPTFPPRDNCCIDFKTFARKELSQRLHLLPSGSFFN